MNEQPFDILAINETKLDININDSQIHLNGYDIIRKDRDRAGGGVCMYIRQSISFKVRNDLFDKSLEIVSLEVQKPNSRSFLVTTWYRPPKTHINCFEEFQLFLQKADVIFNEIYILGDLNCNLNANPIEHHTKHLNDLMDIYQLSQIITEPTRVNANSMTLIDLFITNNKESVISSGVYPLSISDHNLIYAIRKIGIPRSNPRFIQTRNFKHFNQSNFVSDLTTSNWPNLSEFKDVNKAWSAWKSTFEAVVDKHAPIRTVRIRNKPAPWINSKIKFLMLSRDKAKKKASNTGNNEDWVAYRKLRNEVNLKVKRTKADFYQNAILKSANNPNKTWKILNNLVGKKSDNTEINEIIDPISHISVRSQNVAHCLNKHFTTIGPKLASCIPISSVNPEIYLTRSKTKFKLQEVSSSEVLKQLLKVDIGKATGLDGISNKILKMAAPVIFEDITVLFNKSIVQAEFLADWKVAKAIPIFKSGEKHDANNYRPISILSNVARVFERLVYNQFYNYLVTNSLLNPHQSGFRSLHSTVTALLDLTNEWCFNIDRGMVNGVIFLDLKKAFDTVDHSLLLTKLEYFGLDVSTIAWFKSYLAGRTQKCYVNGVISQSEPITCGVPQGSILGPLLFLIFINDLTSCIEFGTGRMYADDTNVTFSSSNLIDLQQVMAKDLKHLTTWLSANKLTLNILKSEFMVIGSRQRTATFDNDVKLSISGLSLSMVDKVKCLGILIDKHLTWKVHINSVTKKVVSALWILKKIKKCVRQKDLCSIYRSIIEPYFDYCSIVWDGIGIELSKKLQKLQSRAARIITGTSYMTSSSNVLSKLNWAPLKERRLEQMAIMMFKIANKLAPRYLTDIFHNAFGSKSYDLRNSEMNFAYPKNKTDYYRNSFAFNGAKLWNSLPVTLKGAESVEAFKKLLKSVDLHQLIKKN